MTITATDLPSPTIPVTASGPPGTPGTCPGRGGGGSWPGTGNGGGGSAPGGGAWPGTGVVTRGMNGSGRPVGPCGTHDVLGSVCVAGAPGAGARAGAGAWAGARPGAVAPGAAAGGGEGGRVAAGGGPPPPKNPPGPT